MAAGVRMVSAWCLILTTSLPSEDCLDFIFHVKDLFFSPHHFQVFHLTREIRASNVSHTVVLRPLKAGYFNFTSASVSYVAQEGGQVVVRAADPLSPPRRVCGVKYQIDSFCVLMFGRWATPAPPARAASWLRGSLTGASPHIM